VICSALEDVLDPVVSDFARVNIVRLGELHEELQPCRPAVEFVVQVPKRLPRLVAVALLRDHGFELAEGETQIVPAEHFQLPVGT
jgi:hypothetical protein